MRLADGRLAVPTLRKDKFVFEQWQERLGNLELVEIRNLPDNDTRLRCENAGYVYRIDGRVLAVPHVDEAALEDCDHADIVVAPFIIRDCAAKTLIDDTKLWNHGAHVFISRET